MAGLMKLMVICLGIKVCASWDLNVQIFKITEMFSNVEFPHFLVSVMILYLDFFE